MLPILKKSVFHKRLDMEAVGKRREEGPKGVIIQCLNQ